MRVLAINGSERRDGWTSQVARFALERAGDRRCETQQIDLADYRINACACGQCNSRMSPCPVDDDVPVIVHAMENADAILLVAPVHGFGLAATMQLFVERAGVGLMRFHRPLTNKLGGVIVTGRRYSLSEVHAQLTDNLLLNRLIVVGSGFPALVHTAGADGAWDDREGLDTVCRTVDRIVDVGQALEAAGVLLPLPEQVELRIGRTG